MTDTTNQDRLDKVDAGLAQMVNDFKGTGIRCITVDPTYYPIIEFTIRTTDGSFKRRRDVSND